MPRLLMILVLSLLMATSGCSNTRMGYNFMDWWASWQIRKYVSLDRPQRQLFSSEFDALHDWHRETQLPRYVAFMEQNLTLLDREEPLTEEDIQTLLNDAQAKWETVMERALEPTAKFVATFSDAQAKELVANIQDQQKEWLEDDDDRTPAERLEEQTERWLGKVTDTQRELIAEWEKDFRSNTEHRRDSQVRWLEELERVLAERDDQEALAKGVRRLLLESDWQFSEEHLETVEHNRKRSVDLMVNILNERTDDQEAHLRSRVQGYISDFQRLAR